MSIKKEKEIIEQMIRLYCQKKEKNKELCSDCIELLNYANSRLNHCVFGDKKGTCKMCVVHCYKPNMRAKIKEVMRFSGPRMIIYAPLTTIRHLLNI